MSVATQPVAAQAFRSLAATVVRRICLVPERLTVTQWADKYRVLPDTSTNPGPYNSAVVPYARRWMDLLADPSVSRIAMCWASQLSKSTVFENAIAYRICRMPSPMIVVQPKEDAAESWVRERFMPTVAKMPELQKRVRGGESTMRYKRFPGGFLFVASGRSGSDLAARSAPFLLVDEVDLLVYLPAEGDPVAIVEKRQAAAEIGCLALVSTPREADTTRIWPEMEGGTDERYHVPCPHCGEKQVLRWGGANEEFGVKWPHGKPSEAQYLCVHCKELIDHREKRAMLAAGEWVAQRPDHPYPSSHLSALYSPFARSSWGVLAQEFVKATGKPQDLQVFTNTRLAELWKADMEQIDASSLDAAGRRSVWDEGTVPEAVRVVTCGIDVQSNRIEVALWGWAAGLESWYLAHEIFPGDPTEAPSSAGSPFRLAEAFILKGLPREGTGEMVPVRAGLCDSGHATTQVYRWTKRLLRRSIFASKGVGGPGVPLLSKPTLQTSERHLLYAIGTDGAKDEFLRQQLLEVRRGPRFVHLPIAEWLDSGILAQLTAEKRVRAISRGRPAWVWKRKNNELPNEALDLRILARMALELPAMSRIRKQLVAVDPQESADVSSGKQLPAYPQRDAILAPMRPPPDPVAALRRRMLARARRGH